MNSPDQIQPTTGRMARAMQILLGIELIGYSLGAWSQIQAGTSVFGAIVCMIGIYLIIRVVAVGSNFAQTWWARSPKSPEHELGVIGTLRLLWGEYYATVITYSFLFPFEAWLVALAPKQLQPGAGTPIILVPGFSCNRGYWGSMARYLGRQGYGPVYAVSLEPLLGSMQDNAKHLSRYVEAVCEQTGAEKVILVGHSMGGVVSRVYVHELDGAKRVAKILALGSPHEGTVLAKALSGLGGNLEQMSYGNDWAKAFNQNQAQDCPVPITAIITPHDNIVGPQSSTHLHYPNAKNIFLPGIGHLEMVISKPVMKVVASEVEGIL